MWKKKPINIFLSALFILVIIWLGFIRDSIFININYIIDRIYYNIEVVYYHSMYEFLVPMGVGGLMKLKWGLTALFAAANYLLSYGILKNLFKEPKLPVSLLSYGYLFLLLLSSLFFIGGKILGDAELGYTLSRRFMGVLQSPVPLMLVTAVHLLFASQKNRT